MCNLGSLNPIHIGTYLFIITRNSRTKIYERVSIFDDFDCTYDLILAVFLSPLLPFRVFNQRLKLTSIYIITKQRVTLLQDIKFSYLPCSRLLYINRPHRNINHIPFRRCLQRYVNYIHSNYIRDYAIIRFFTMWFWENLPINRGISFQEMIKRMYTRDIYISIFKEM